MRSLLWTWLAVFLSGCALWSEALEVRLDFGPSAEGLALASPPGELSLATGLGLTRLPLRWGESTTVTVSRYSSGLAIWEAPGVEWLGAVWTEAPDRVVLDPVGGWIARALSLCQREGVPIGKWDLKAIADYVRKAAKGKSLWYYDERLLAAALAGGREGGGTLVGRPTRSVALPKIEGSWSSLWSGLPGLQEATWPVGLWTYQGFERRLWVMIPEEGPVVLRFEPPLPEDEVDEPVGDDDDP